MATTLDITREELETLYERLANEYCRSLPLEHFIESTDQATQRKITLESLDLVLKQANAAADRCVHFMSL